MASIPGWNLPTYHPASLKVQAYMRFLKPNQPWFETDASSATHISPERTLPVLVRVPDAAAGDKASGATDGSDKAGDAPIAGSGQIVDYLASSGDAVRTGSSDGLVSLSPTEAADMEAYTAMVEHKLYVAMLYEAWAVKTTYSGITKPAMAAAFPFPLNLYLPALMRWRNVQRCERCGINTPQRAESAARSCLAALEARLASAASVALGQGSTSEYFFGSEPSALDATVYAYIETIYRSPYNGCWQVEVSGQPRDLKELLQQYPHLLAHRERITNRFFKAYIPRAGEVPPPPEPASKEDEEAAAAAAAAAAVPPQSPEEIAQWEEAKCWMGGAAALLLSYVLTSTDWLGEDDEDLD